SRLSLSSLSALSAPPGLHSFPTRRSSDLGADLGSVRSVYYRRPSQFSLAEGMVGPEQRWAYREARMGFGGVLLALDCLWINRPSDRKSTRLNSVTVRSRMASSALKKKSSQ